jgi:hypothetical protein
MAAKGSKSLDLGVLQTEAENSAKLLKQASGEYRRAKQKFEAADERHQVALKALSAGVDTLRNQVSFREH